MYSNRGRHLTSEFSETSALPETTRVGNLTSGSEDNAAGTRSEDVGGLGVGFGGIAGPGLGASVEGTPMAYSSDELAVLAESFFNQDLQIGGNIGGSAGSSVGGIDDWWATGNL